MIKVVFSIRDNKLIPHVPVHVIIAIKCTVISSRAACMNAALLPNSDTSTIPSVLPREN